MDATPKGPPVPPTPDILPSLFSRGISDLNVTASFRGQHRRRRISRHPSLDARRKTEATAHASSSSFTCLNFSRLFRRKLKQLPILYLRRVASSQPVQARNLTTVTLNGPPTTEKRSRSWCSSARTTVGTTALRTKRDPARIPTISSLLSSSGVRRPFFTPVFTPRPPSRTFDAFSTTPVASEERGSRRTKEEVLLLTGVVSFRAKHIHRLRPETPKSKSQPNRRPRKQCRAALPRVLCKVSASVNSLLCIH